MTENSAFKNQVRARMAETGEKYTEARRAVIAEHDAGQPPVILRVYLNPYVDLELTAEAGREYSGAGERGQRDMVDRLFAEHIEVAGFEEAKIAVSSAIMTDGDLTAEQNAAEDAAIREAVQQSVARAAGLVVVEIERTSDLVRVYVHTTQPDIVIGDRGAEADRIRDELQRLTSKRVRLDVLRVPSPAGS